MKQLEQGGRVGQLEWPIHDIKVGARKRSINSGKVAQLRDSIEQVGLLSPVLVREDGGLIAGLHRLEACKELGWSTIPAIARNDDELQTELIEIDENLIRSELTALEHAEHLARRKHIYEAMHPETRHGVAGGLASTTKRSGKPTNDNLSFVPSFTADTAQRLGVSVRTIQRDIEIAESLTDEVKEMIRDTEIANRKMDLVELAALEPKTQRRVAEMATATRGAQDAGVGFAIDQLREESPTPKHRIKHLEREVRREQDKERIEYAAEHPEDVPVGKRWQEQAGAGGWLCEFKVEGEINGLPVTSCECVDEEYQRLKEGESPREVLLKADNLLYSIDETERNLRTFLKGFVAQDAYWVDWDRGVRRMSSELIAGLRELQNNISEFKKQHRRAIDEFRPKAS